MHLDTEEPTRALFFNVRRLIRQIHFQLRASSGCFAKSFTPRSAFPHYDLSRDGKEYRFWCSIRFRFFASIRKLGSVCIRFS